VPGARRASARGSRHVPARDRRRHGRIAPGAPALLETAALAERLHVPVDVVVAARGAPLDLDGLRRTAHIRWSDADPVTSLVAVSREVDLLLVGSRGLHGLRALGSVSERVAHRAACSVLVVRPSAAHSSPAQLREEAS
jgi:nucleotide-binding universal stress UspA family protein